MANKPSPLQKTLDKKVYTPKLNEKKIQDMLTGKTKISTMDIKPRQKQLSDWEKAQALKEAIRKKTGTYPNTAN
jgi:hypothetical protein